MKHNYFYNMSYLIKRGQHKLTAVTTFYYHSQISEIFILYTNTMSRYNRHYMNGIYISSLFQRYSCI